MDADAAGTMKIENTEKRDVLCATEKKYQKLWEEEKAFEANAPSLKDYPPSQFSPEELAAKIPKYFATMAYPYVNGAPHLGHAFTVSKVEFSSRVARAQGKNTLYPQGFHATGMPIKACADKLINEIALFGKNFEGYNEDEEAEAAPKAAPAQAKPKEDVTKFTNTKKGKAAMKSAKVKYQFQVMLSLGIPREEIHKFADSQYWLHYFPQEWRQHLTSFGCGIDWRRSFITTDVNAYYDSFVRWQMRRLKELGKIRFGKRYTIYSPKDSQPCLDHDRASGEGVLTQEYTALKCRVKTFSPAAQKTLAAQSGSIQAGANVFMIAATLRPETMYGQTNLFVSPTITYGLFQVGDNDFYLATDRAGRNMAFQGIFPEWATVPKVGQIDGGDLIGSLVEAPLSVHGAVYVLPMTTIKEAKGTGVVTSVPSDSPDDYAMTMDLSKKAEFYGIQPEWVCTEILPIIETPEYKGPIAPALVQKMKINSPKDYQQLADAKEIAYKVGFYQGKMVHGKYVGKTVQEAKPLVRQQLLDAGDAFVYCEPDGQVISRSGNECVAAFLDQWFLAYGVDTEWRDDTISHLRGDDGLQFQTFGPATKHSLEQTFGWMMEWSVTRQFGLGTNLPWDPSQMVEGLSDSTIYMAYYTIAHYLHGDVYGKTKGLANIDAAQMTDAVWDYVFALSDSADTAEAKSDVPPAALEAMRREFTYWYPLDIRTSGKDLINNHLVFFLYIHQAIWGKKAARYLPRGIRLNGHLLLNGDKMSKSTGNFLTLDSAIQKFGADATRLALADGGDGVDDANFEEATANAAILRLYELRRWVERVVLEARLMKPGDDFAAARESDKPENADCNQRTGPASFWDKLFDNDLNALIIEAVQAYEATNFKAALKAGFFDFTSARDTYRAAASAAGIGMHHDNVRRYVEAQALLLSVVAPHWSDYVWREVLKKPSSIQKATFPKVPALDATLTTISDYVRRSLARVRTADAVQQKRAAKGKELLYDPTKGKALNVYVAHKWPAWQTRYIDLVRELFDGVTLDTKQAAKKIQKPDMKKAMPFVQDLKRRLEGGERADSVFDRTLGFDELEVVRELVPILISTVPKLQDVRIVVVDGPEATKEGAPKLPDVAATAEPGSPALEFVNL